MDDTIPKLKTEAALKGLAALKDTNAGRPRKRVEGEEKKLPPENDTGEARDSGGTQMAAGELASEFEISVDDVISPPSEVVDFRQSLEAEKPDVLRGRLTKAAFENKGLRRWINQVMKQLQEAKRGGNVSIVAPPSGLLPEAAGVNDDSEGALKVLKAMAPYLMIKDLFKEDSGEDGKSQSQGMIKYKSADGEEFEYPAGSFPPGYNPFFGKQGKEDGDEKTVTVKIGENEITGPPSYVNAMVPIVMAQQRQGEDGGGGTKALEQVIELQKMMLERERGNGNPVEEKEEKMITVIEEDGKSVEIPASVYPQYMMMQSVVKQQKMFMEQQRQLQRGSRGSSEGGSTRESATVYAALAKMNDMMVQMAAAMDPERLGANAVKGLKNKLEEWNEIRAFVGGGGEDSEVMKERIKAQEETRRKELEENTKLAREIEKTKQAELDARKFDMLMNPQPWQTMPQQQQQVQQALEEEEEPRVTEEEAFAHSKEVNKRFLEEIEEERSEGLEGEEGD